MQCSLILEQEAACFFFVVALGLSLILTCNTLLVELFLFISRSLKILLLNGTGLKGDVSGFTGLHHLTRLDVADCPALIGDPHTLYSMFGEDITVNY